MTKTNLTLLHKRKLYQRNHTLGLLNIYDTLNTSDEVIAQTAVDKSIEYLLENQNPDGSWDSAYWFGGFWFLSLPPTIHVGSAEITTGFVLEALAKYQAVTSLNLNIGLEKEKMFFLTVEVLYKILFK